MHRRLGLLFFTSLLTVAACGQDHGTPETNPPAEPPPFDYSLTATETFHWKRSSSPEIVLLIADDAATADAAALRAKLAEAVRTGMLSEIDERWSGACGNRDPAAWHPGNYRVIVVRPSAPDAEAPITPLDAPELAWVTEKSSKDEVEPLVTGLKSALEKRLAAPGDLYRPLRAAQRAIDLLDGARAPATAAESALVASLPKNPVVHAIIGSGRDDEDPTSIAALLPKQPPSSSFYSTVTLLGPFPAASGCYAADGSGTRLEAWEKSALFGATSRLTWPCGDQDTWDHLLSACCPDCALICHARSMVVSPSGVAKCDITVDQLDLTQCDPARGFRDPDGQPTIISSPGETRRRCEVVQLEGAMLDACRHSLDCPGCASGYCATEVPDLLPASACYAGNSYWPIRLTGKAWDPTAGETVTVTCATQ